MTNSQSKKQTTTEDIDRACNAVTILIQQSDTGREKEASFAALELNRYLSPRNYCVIPSRNMEGNPC